MSKISIAVLTSGKEPNFQAIIEGIKKNEINGEIKVLITDNQHAKAISIAEKNNIPTRIVKESDFNNRISMDLKIKEYLDYFSVDLVVLTRYMKIIKSKELLNSYKYKIINLHPSLFPAFKGSRHAQKDAFEYGCKISGFTIHFVTRELDEGPIIYQRAVDISDCNSADEVSDKITKYELESYKQVISSFTKGKYIIKGKKAIFVKN